MVEPVKTKGSSKSAFLDDIEDDDFDLESDLADEDDTEIVDEAMGDEEFADEDEEEGGAKFEEEFDPEDDEGSSQTEGNYSTDGATTTLSISRKMMILTAN